MTTYFTWNTKKNQNNTFSYVVKKVTSTNEMQENGHYAITIIVKEGVCKTRARAKRKGIQWTRYLQLKEQA